MEFTFSPFVTYHYLLLINEIGIIFLIPSLPALCRGEARFPWRIQTQPELDEGDVDGSSGDRQVLDDSGREQQQHALRVLEQNTVYKGPRFQYTQPESSVPGENLSLSTNCPSAKCLY